MLSSFLKIHFQREPKNAFKQSKPDQNLIISIIALLVGSLYSLYLLGIDVINPTNIDWLFNNGDPATYLIGWLYFRDDTWHWPLTFTDDLAYPTGASISYTDSIPLWAITFKIFSFLLPNNFQYFGIFVLLSFILHFFWGAKLGLLFSKNSLLAGLAAGSLCMLAPPLTWRVGGHIALTSHWFILAAIWSFFKLNSSINYKKIFIFQAVIILMASGINPYFCIMSLALILTSHLQLLITKKIKAFTYFKLLITYPLLLVCGWYIFGYLSGDSSYGNSYGFYSLNLTALFNPIEKYSSFLKPLPVNEGQYEGFNYLGVGILFLILINVIRGITYKPVHNFKDVLKLIQQNWLILILCICLTLLALSNKIYWQNTEIINYQLPPQLESLFSKFRCSGRFFWPVHYLILLGVIVSTFKLWKHRKITLILSLIIILQFFDLLPLQARSTQWLDNLHINHSKFLKSKEWYQLEKDYSKLMIFPSFQCDFPPAEFPIFEKVAVLQKLKTNSAYLARYNPSDIKIHCEQLPEQISSGQLDKNSAYVLDKKKYFTLYTTINRDQNNSHYCSDIDGYILCRKRKGDEQGVINLTAFPYSINEILNFSNEENTSLKYQYGDWSINESGRTWTDGTEAHLLLDIQKNFKNNLFLNVEVIPFIAEKHPQQVVDVLINNQFLTQWTFQNGEQYPTKRQALIPAELINNNSQLQITFRLLKPVSPASIGYNEDQRLLGLAFQKLQLSEQKP